jgi:DNA-binding XRE family transcriptional regulator
MKPLEIKGARARLGYKQQFMADNLGISVATYRKKESGVIRFTDKEKAAVTKLLELTPAQMNDFLFDGELPIGSAN